MQPAEDSALSVIPKLEPAGCWIEGTEGGLTGPKSSQRGVQSPNDQATTLVFLLVDLHARNINETFRDHLQVCARLVVRFAGAAGSRVGKGVRVVEGVLVFAA